MTALFELIQVSLGTRDELSSSLGSDAWIKILYEARRQAIVGVLMDGIERLSDIQKPPKEVLLQWICETHVVEQNWLLHDKRAKELSLLFRKDSIESCILKGVGLSLLYPNPKRRIGGDIDLWVNGNRRDVMNWLCKQFVVKHIVWHHVDVDCFKDVSVEVHFRPSFLYNPVHRRKLMRFFKDELSHQMGLKEEGYGYPTGDFNAVFSLTHMFHHLLEEGVGFRHVVDYFYIIKSLSTTEREKSLAVIKSIGLYDFLSSIMFVLKFICGMSSDLLLCEPNEIKGKFVLEEILEEGNFGKVRKGNGLKHNSIRRFWVMGRQFPNEATWMIPWKVYQVCWRLINR